KAAQARQEREAQETKDKEGRKAYMRRQKRAKHAEDLDHLMALTAPELIDRILREYRVSAEDRVSELLDSVPAAIRPDCRRAHEDAWIFGVRPAPWQLMAYDPSVARRCSSDTFNQRDVDT